MYKVTENGNTQVKYKYLTFYLSTVLEYINLHSITAKRDINIVFYHKKMFQNIRNNIFFFIYDDDKQLRWY